MTYQRIEPGSKVTFTRHINGLVYKVVIREGDDCSIQDPRGRVLRNVPVEDLRLEVDPDATVRIEPEQKAWREVDELEAY